MMRASAIVLLGNITNVKQCGHKMTHCAACPGVGGGKIELVLELADPAVRARVCVWGGSAVSCCCVWAQPVPARAAPACALRTHARTL
jgi:hypothetical protein